MFEGTTFLALVAGLFAVHLAVAWLARRADGPGDERPDRLEDGRVRCPHCGAANEPAYRFCRECVGELRDVAPTVPVRPASGGSLFR